MRRIGDSHGTGKVGAHQRARVLLVKTAKRAPVRVLVEVPRAEIALLFFLIHLHDEGRIVSIDLGVDA